MGDAIQCRARMVGDGVDVRCQIWTNADPQGRHAGDHDAYGKRWTNFNPPPDFGRRCESTNLSDRCEGLADHYGDHRWKARQWRDQSSFSDESLAACEAGQPSACDAQVGGDHYRKFKIQPWDIWEEYGLDAFTGTVVKYLLRAGHKGDKLEDLRKARHTLDRLIEIEEAKEG